MRPDGPRGVRTRRLWHDCMPIQPRVHCDQCGSGRTAARTPRTPTVQGVRAADTAPDTYVLRVDTGHNPGHLTGQPLGHRSKGAHLGPRDPRGRAATTGEASSPVRRPPVGCVARTSQCGQ
jgi:hypothetical protein